MDALSKLFEPGFLIGILGIVTSLISVILTSKRAKESNEITKKILIDNVIIDEKRAHIQKLTDLLCNLLESTSVHKLAQYFQMGCVLGGNQSSSDFTNEIAEQQMMISLLKDKVYMQMQIDDKMFYDHMIQVGKEATRIYDEIKIIKNYSEHKRDEIKLNSSALHRINTPDELYNLCTDKEKIQHVKESLGEYSHAHALLTALAKKYLDIVKTDFNNNINAMSVTGGDCQ